MGTSTLSRFGRVFREFTRGRNAGCALFLIFAVGEVVSTPSASAAVYKCLSSDGSLTYSDTPCASNPQRIYPQNAVTRISPNIATPQIVSATYTSPRNGRALDVTAQLRSQCAAGSASCIVNCGNQLAGDPDFGQRKYCRIEYGCSDGKPQELRVPEGTRSTLSCTLSVQDKPTRETSATLCSVKTFNAWLKAQGRPMPDPNVRLAKLGEIGNRCRRSLGLSDMVPPAPIPKRTPILGGAAGAAAAANLAQLVKSGSVDRLQKYLATPGVDINARPGTDEALLDYAAEQNQAAIAQILIERGANVNAVQQQGRNAGYSALHRAAIVDAADVAGLLLAHGAEVNIGGPLGVTPLILAASHGSRRTVGLLLEHGADVQRPDGHGETALSLASAHNYPDIVKQLLIHLPAPTSYSMNNVAMRGDLEALRLMMRHDELVHDISAEMKDEALRFVILEGPNPLPVREQMIELLLADGADIDNHPAGLNVIPLMLAPSPEMAEFLFAFGANQKAKLSGALLAQWFVCNNSSKNHLGLVQVLVARGIDIGGSTSPGQSALPCAEHANDSQLIAFLQAHQVGVDSPGGIASAPKRVDATHAVLEDQLHPKRPCVRLDEIRNSPTPMELYGAVRDCLQNKRDADAVALFALAGMDSSFDSLRIIDKTAGQAREIIIMDLFQGMSTEVRARFQYAMKNEIADVRRHATLCNQIEKIGPPRYFPAYMVNHGMGAIQRSLTGQAQPGPLEPNFDAARTWTSLLANYLNCSALPKLQN